MAGEGPQRRGGLGRMRLPPAPAQKDVGLGRVDEETIAVGGQERRRLPAVLPGPGAAVVAFDHAESQSRPGRINRAGHPQAAAVRRAAMVGRTTAGGWNPRLIAT